MSRRRPRWSRHDTHMTAATLAAIAFVVLLAFCPFWVWIAVIYFGVAWLVAGLCWAAKTGDEMVARARREAQDERAARARIYPGSGFRG